MELSEEVDPVPEEHGSLVADVVERPLEHGDVESTGSKSIVSLLRGEDLSSSTTFPQEPGRGIVGGCRL